MGKGLLGVLGAIVIVIVLGGIVMITKYNGLVSGEEAIDSRWAQIDNQLQRRYDLIPNLVETVKGFAAQEREIIAEVTEARTKYGSASTVEETAAADSELTSALGRLLVVVENYPELKSDANFRQLMDELAGTENRLAVAREDYNNEVQDFNSSIRRFPGNMIASMFGFERKDYYEIESNANSKPIINFGGND